MKKIKLTRGKYALVDDEDFDWLNQWKWRYHSNGYAARSLKRIEGKRPLEYMHRVVLGVRKGQETDHINRNRLDNQRSNLRFSDRVKNMHNIGLRPWNKSGFAGVWWHKQTQKWATTTRVKYKRVWLGLFKSKEEAAEVYKNAVERLYEK